MGGFLFCLETPSIWYVRKESGGEGNRCRMHISHLLEEQSDEFWLMSFTESQIL